MNILTAQQFIAQGTSAASVASIARYLDSDEGGRVPQPKLAAAVRRVAEEVAALTGVKLYGKRGHYVAPKARRANNDNRRQGQSKKRRAA